MPLAPLDGRIAIALEGQPVDLDDACSFFPEGEGEVQVCKTTIPPNEKYVLLADVLNGLTDETEVIRMAGRLIDLVNGVLFLEDPQRQPIAWRGYTSPTVHDELSFGYSYPPRAQKFNVSPA